MDDRKRVAAPRGPQGAPSPKAVLLVGGEREWPPDLRTALVGAGYLAETVPDLSLVPSLLTGGDARALLVFDRPRGASDLLVLQRVRELSPRTAIVVVTHTPTDPDLKRAFEAGATAFLSWPAAAEALRHAVESGALPPRPPASKGTRA